MIVYAIEDSSCDHGTPITCPPFFESVSNALTSRLGYRVPVLAEIPLDPRLRVGGDEGSPIVVDAPETTAAKALLDLADGIASRGRNLVGRQLGLSPI